MSDSLPHGVIIGEMQVPFKWMLSHAARFQGLIRVRVGGGEGYVVVQKGRPVGCYFQQEDAVLRGKSAYLHLTSVLVVNLVIHRYTSEEMEEAIHLVKVSGAGYPEVDALSEGRPGRVLAEQNGETEGEPADAPAADMAVDTSITVKEPAIQKPAQPVAEKGVILPSGLDTENLAHLLLGRLLRLPGVQAVSIFGRGTSVLSIGNVNLDLLVVLADDMLQAAKAISLVMHTGSFVQLTLQIPAGKVIIAPYFNEYLCILTGPEVNLGQIRKILKEIPAAADTGKRDS
ncbi:MAG: hypothetical protein MUC66_05810 [Methanolinea sp.]|jgi:predicted regulator of Ras-like GTPase activity (Roadblock/LC7/MglB family)|nr:hypothetical protein [Methanolinea sp.]